MDDTIEKLLAKLQGVTWTRSKPGVEQTIASLGARLVETVPGRSTYRTSEGPSLSLYFEGERADFVEVTLEALPDPHLLTEVEYEKKADEFHQKSQAAVATGTRILGPPAFSDGAARDGFPEDQDAVWFALWPSVNSRLMIEQKHEEGIAHPSLHCRCSPLRSRNPEMSEGQLLDAYRTATQIRVSGELGTSYAHRTVRWWWGGT